jgi:hypothetical protein
MANTPCYNCGGTVTAPVVYAPAPCVPANPCPGNIPVTPCAPDPCPELVVVPLQLDASAIFYHKDGCTTSKLSCLAAPNGIPIDLILETIDTRLCQVTNTYNYDQYELSCLRSRYIVHSNEDFAESVDDEICRLNTLVNNNTAILTKNINALSVRVETIYHPNINNPYGFGFNNGSTVNEVLQVLTNLAGTAQSQANVDSSPPLKAMSSSSVSLATAGEKDHDLQASVKVSTARNNILSINSDGLFAPAQQAPNQLQALGWDSVNRKLSLSGGGGTVIIEEGATQILSFNSTTKILTLSAGGGAVDLSPLVSATQTETAIAAMPSGSITWTLSGMKNHTLYAEVKVSVDPSNALSLHSNGLYVQSTQETPIETLDSDSIILVASGADSHQLTASLNVDAITAANALIVTQYGVYVPTMTETANTGQVTDTATVVVSGDLGRTICANVKLDPNSSNLLTSTPSGLLVLGSGGGIDTNFATSNLTASNDRTHNWASHTLTINNADAITFVAGVTTTPPYSSIGLNNDASIGLFTKSTRAELSVKLDGSGTGQNPNKDTLSLQAQTPDQATISQVLLSPAEIKLINRASGTVYTITVPLSNGYVITSINGTTADISGNINLPNLSDTNFGNADLTFSASRVHYIPAAYGLEMKAGTSDYSGLTTAFLQTKDAAQLYTQSDKRHKSIVDTRTPSGVPTVTLASTVYQDDANTTLLTGMRLDITDSQLTVRKNGGPARELVRSVNGVYADIAGNITVAPDGLITADNGLTASTSSNVRLGGSLAANTTIDTTSAYKLTVQGSSAPGNPIFIINNTGGSQTLGLKAIAQNGTGVWGEATTGSGVYGTGTAYGVQGVSTAGTGVSAASTTGVGLDSQSNGSFAGKFTTTLTTTNTAAEVLYLARMSTLTPGPNIGVSIGMYIHAAGSGAQLGNKITSKWVDPNNATRTSQLEIQGVANTVTKTLMQLTGTGQLILSQYGHDTFASASPLRALYVDASGNVVEIVPPTSIVDTLQQSTTAGNTTTKAVIIGSSTPGKASLDGQLVQGASSSITGNATDAAAFNNATVNGGTYAFAVNRSTAIGSNSFAAGVDNTASGYNSSVFGRLNNVAGEGSIAFGYSNDVQPKFCVVLGKSNLTVAGTPGWCEANLLAGISNINGSYAKASFAMGYNNNVNCEYSIGMGDSNYITARASVGIGKGSKTYTIGEFVYSSGAPYSGDNTGKGGNSVGTAQTSLINMSNYEATGSNNKTLEVKMCTDTNGNTIACGGGDSSIYGLTYYQMDNNSIYWIEARFMGLASTSDATIWTLSTWAKVDSGVVTTGTNNFTQILKDAAFSTGGSVLSAVTLNIVPGTGNLKQLRITYTSASFLSNAQYTCFLTINKLSYV